MGGSMSDLSTSNTAFTIDILAYDTTNHRFSPDLQIKERSGGSFRDVSMKEAEEKGVCPSSQWMEMYRKWNCFEDSTHGSMGHPVFAEVSELRSFNQQGELLATMLQDELREKSVKVASYKPVYTDIEVGDIVSAWWHLRDRNYGMIIPIQQLPVSADLKSSLQAWRMLKHQNLLDTTCCSTMNHQGHVLEERILHELNQPMDRLEVISDTSIPSSFEELEHDMTIKSLATTVESKRASEKVY
jgi:hypothetical protein